MNALMILGRGALIAAIGLLAWQALVWLTGVPAFILPGPARPALIGVSSIALTRQARIASSCAS